MRCGNRSDLCKFPLRSAGIFHPGSSAEELPDLRPVSYTHLDVYKRQEESGSIDAAILLESLFGIKISGSYLDYKGLLRKYGKSYVQYAYK